MKNTSRPKLTVVLVLLLITTTTVAQQAEKTATDYVTAGVEAQKAGKFEEAVQQYAEALKLDPKKFGAQFNSGACYMALHKPEQALGFFKIAVAIRPNDAIVQFALGNAY